MKTIRTFIDEHEVLVGILAFILFFTTLVLIQRYGEHDPRMYECEMESYP
jgi:hypothetical protein